MTFEKALKVLRQAYLEQLKLGRLDLDRAVMPVKIETVEALISLGVEQGLDNHTAGMVEQVIEAASEHADEHDAPETGMEMQVGDLEEALRLVWKVLTGNQRVILLSRIMDQVFNTEEEE